MGRFCMLCVIVIVFALHFDNFMLLSCVWRQVSFFIISGHWMLGQNTITNVHQFYIIMALNYPVTYYLQNELFCVIFLQFIFVYQFWIIYNCCMLSKSRIHFCFVPAHTVFATWCGIPSAYCIDSRPEWVLNYDLGTPSRLHLVWQLWKL